MNTKLKTSRQREYYASVISDLCDCELKEYEVQKLRSAFSISKKEIEIVRKVSVLPKFCASNKKSLSVDKAKLKLDVVTKKVKINVLTMNEDVSLISNFMLKLKIDTNSEIAKYIDTLVGDAIPGIFINRHDVYYRIPKQLAMLLNYLKTPIVKTKSAAKSEVMSLLDDTDKVKFALKEALKDNEFVSMIKDMYPTIEEMAEELQEENKNSNLIIKTKKVKEKDEVIN